ncbi:MAG: MgtC/SapB family protein [Clostridiales bacterium]|nr:MgtC/SapB family protein [Clostridiales bacterium]
MALYIEVFIKLLLSVVLGGIVGFEREYKSRPAGLRTHILVCIGAALVQITAINYFRTSGLTNMDPMRLGAQVISGIGFLGAGTILKEGANIKGLTTAASIWVVGCIGVAAGTGLYIEATAATILIYVSLRGFKILEDKMTRGKKYINLEIAAKNTPGMIGKIGNLFGELEISIDTIDISDNDEEQVIIFLTLKLKNIIPIEKLVDDLISIDGVHKVKQV